jgi:hypothetical protein
MGFTVLVPFQNLREAGIAIDAVAAYRSGGSPSAAPGNVQPRDANRELADRIEKALNASPLNNTKKRVLRTLLAAGEWIPYPDIVGAVAKDVGPPEDAANRAKAALRDLSEQMKRSLPASDLTGEKSIEVLAARSRSAGVLQYRLTVAGRAAVRRFLAAAPS